MTSDTGSVRAGTLARLASLIVPVDCPGCRLADVRWCEDCEAPWWEAPVRCETGAARLEAIDPPLPVWAVTVLEGAAHGMVAAWKDAGRRDLDGLFASAARRGAAALAPALVVTGSGSHTMAVVPCPARPAHTRRRGADLPGLLAHAVADGLAAAGLEPSIVPALAAHAGGSRGAGDRARWRVSGERLTGVHTRLTQSTPALLVDDVITTGATLARAVQALHRTPLVPVGAFTLASAPGPRASAAVALL